MRVDVVMPQMGESIAEGTITRWMKQIGDSVSRDEPLFEISTDKVDAEIPSPAAGKLVEIKNQAGETVPVNQVVAVLDTDASAAVSATPAAAKAAPEAPKAAAAPAPAPQAAPAAPAPKAPEAPEAATPRGEGGFISPVVRKIADEHGIDPARVNGTGAGGRVTKKDILDFVAQGGATAAPAAAAAPAPAARPAAPAAAPAAASPVTFAAGARVERQAMSPMRKKIAEHMIESRRTSAHVSSVYEVDMTRVVKMREAYKSVYLERHGTKLTITPFFVKAACDALRAWPVVNSSVDGNDIAPSTPFVGKGVSRERPYHSPDPHPHRPGPADRLGRRRGPRPGR